MKQKILLLLKNPLWIFVFLNNRGFHILDDKKYLCLLYKLEFNKKLDLNNPKTFNEKIQWLKIHDRKDIYISMVDKELAKKYAASIIDSKYIIPTYGIYNRFDEINFDKLPKSFVIKVTHFGGNKGIYIVKDKTSFDYLKCRKNIEHILTKNLFYSGREWPYKMIKPKIIIEKNINEDNKNDINDYKFFCFNGEPKYCLVCSDRNKNLKETFFDMDWNLTQFKRPNHDIDYSIKKPEKLSLMIKLASALSKGFPFLRIDFYEKNGKVYFGEFTFYPASGFNGFDPEEWDRKLGDLISISEGD